jgi:hypothetical protein
MTAMPITKDNMTSTTSQSDRIPVLDPTAEISGYWVLDKVVEGANGPESGPFGFLIGSDLSQMSIEIREDGTGLFPASSTHPMSLMVQSSIESVDEQGNPMEITAHQNDVLCFLTSEENKQYYTVLLSDEYMLLQEYHPDTELSIYYFQRVSQ